MADNIDYWPSEPVMQYPPTKIGGIVAGLFGDVANGGSVFDPNRQAYMQGYDLGERARIGTDVALSALPFVPKGVGLFKQANAYYSPFSKTQLPETWVHGTTEAGKEAILKSGKFDPWAGPRQYSYSELGSDTSYFTRPEGWWLNPEMAMSGRAAVYPTSVGMKLSKDANIKVIDSPYKLDSLAKSVGFKDGNQLLRELDTENLDIQFASNKVKNMSFNDYVANELANRNETIGEWAKAMGFTVDQALDRFKRNYNYLKNFVNDSDNSQAVLAKFKEKGIDGIYIAPDLSAKYEKLSRLKGQNIPSPTSDQLGIFNKDVAIPFDIKTGLEPSIR